MRARNIPLSGHANVRRVLPMIDRATAVPT
jgi:hypothetical protein